jgi:hypothetical protein|tara:strand:- start:326 stop:1213 length:888 start_codon:yes stop_codon:yes gene_type:complete
MEYSAQELKGAGTLNKSILEAGSDYTFFLYRPKNITGQSPSLSGSGYFTFETSRNPNGFYGGVTPYVEGAVFTPGIANSVNTASFGVKSLVTSSYIFSYDLFETTESNMTATSSFEYTPSITAPVGSVFFRATGDYEMEVSPETQTCGTPQAFQGGQNYPTQLQSILGSGTGTVTLTPLPFGIPDRWVIDWDGNDVIDTGYISQTPATYNIGGARRNWITEDLNGLQVPELAVGQVYPQPQGGIFPNVIASDGYPVINPITAAFFSKNAVTSIANIRIYGPIRQTGWNSTLSCPV